MGDIAVGTIIGGYQILEAVGEGGMATVYRAHQLSMNRDVAVKVLPREFLRQGHSLDRFKQEARIVARLEHRAIVPVHDHGEYEGVPYLVMRYMDGGSVDDLLTNGPVAPARTIEILRQIAPALDYAHHSEVLHRDLKPSNILLDANGDAYLTDFGIARLLGEGSTNLTTTGVVGTPSYMSPEQAQGHDLDGRSDVYALGVVLFEMLTGVRPFEGETPYSVAVKHVTEAPPSACAINAKLPHAVDQVLFKALQKQREQRYQSAGELAEALALAVQQGDVKTPPESMFDTEPSLEQALREGGERHRSGTSGSILPHPIPAWGQPPGEQRPLTPNIQVLPPYVAAPSGAYSRAKQPHQRRARGRFSIAGQPPWVMWTVTLLIVGSVILAVAMGLVYYVINDTAPVSDGSGNYSATAIFKLTATRSAILDDLATQTLTEFSAGDIVATPSRTVPPTNTPHPLDDSPTATALVLPGS